MNYGFASYKECTSCGIPAESHSVRCSICWHSNFRQAYKCQGCSNINDKPKCQTCAENREALDLDIPKELYPPIGEPSPLILNSYIVFIFGRLFWGGIIGLIVWGFFLLADSITGWRLNTWQGYVAITASFVGILACLGEQNSNHGVRTFISGCFIGGIIGGIAAWLGWFFSGMVLWCIIGIASKAPSKPSE